MGYRQIFRVLFEASVYSRRAISSPRVYLRRAISSFGLKNIQCRLREVVDFIVKFQSPLEFLFDLRYF